MLQALAARRGPKCRSDVSTEETSLLIRKVSLVLVQLKAPSVQPPAARSAGTGASGDLRGHRGGKELHLLTASPPAKPPHPEPLCLKGHWKVDTSRGTSTSCLARAVRSLGESRLGRGEHQQRWGGPRPPPAQPALGSLRVRNLWICKGRYPERGQQPTSCKPSARGNARAGAWQLAHPGTERCAARLSGASHPGGTGSCPGERRYVQFAAFMSD